MRKQAFTLIELIVVVTILAILGTIAFISFKGYSGNARDSKTISDISTIHKGLQIKKTQNGNVPIPDNALNLTVTDGTIISYEGEVGDKIKPFIKISNDAQMSDSSDYEYITNGTKKHYTVQGIVEKMEIGGNVANISGKLRYIKGDNVLSLYDESSDFVGGNVESQISSAKNAIIGTDNLTIDSNGNVLGIPDKIKNNKNYGILSSGGSCDASTKPFDNGNILFVTGTPTSKNQAYVKGASNCGFTCLNNYTGNSCETPPLPPTPENCFTFSSGTISGYNSSCTKDIVIPSTIGSVAVETIGSEAFVGNLLSSVVIPDSVTSINREAFRDCRLTSVKIGNGVTSIGDVAFGYNRLISVTIPDSVKSIGYNAFYNNLVLESVTLGSGLETIGGQGFRENVIKSINIPEGVTSIGDFAFWSNKLESVTLPTTLTSIGNNVFQGNLITSLEIPSNVTSIGTYAFSGNSMTSLKIPSSVTSIGSYAFQYNNLTISGIDSDCNGGGVTIHSTAFIKNGPSKSDDISSSSICP